MVDLEIFSRRLDALADYLKKIKAFRKTSREEFIAEPAIHDLAEQYLHLAVECVLDLSNHYLASESIGTPDTYKDSFFMLSEAGRMSSDMAAKLASWAGFRNILVHEYLAIDHGLAWDAIQKDLADLEAFHRWAVEKLS
jgi:uncharacterized protein YutE (UPF0331/DUF86 family)